jgi:ribosome-binding factor A
MAWLHRHRVEFQSHIAKTVSLKFTPRLHFRVTQSIEKGDHVLNLLNEILPDDPEPADVTMEPNAGDDPDER